MATVKTVDEHYPGPDEIRGLVRSLGPTTLLDLFCDHGIPESERMALLEETLAILVVHGHRVDDLRAWFLEALEDRCHAYLVAHPPTC